MLRIASSLQRVSLIDPRIWLGFAFAVTAFLFTSGSVQAQSLCKPVYGGFTAVPAAPEDCTSPVGFCTVGQLIGGLQGEYQFTMATIEPSGSTGVPAVNFYTGESVITTKKGATMIGTDTGAIDFNPAGSGKFAALITLIDGASGYLVLRGALNFETGNASGDYRGEVCSF